MESKLGRLGFMIGNDYAFLIPLSLIVWLLISKLQAVNLNPVTLLKPVEQVAGLIQEKNGYNILSKGNLNVVISVYPKLGKN